MRVMNKSPKFTSNLILFLLVRQMGFAEASVRWSSISVGFRDHYALLKICFNTVVNFAEKDKDSGKGDFSRIILICEWLVRRRK